MALLAPLDFLQEDCIKTTVFLKRPRVRAQSMSRLNSFMEIRPSKTKRHASRLQAVVVQGRKVMQGNLINLTQILMAVDGKLI